ncbi:hypothetical protein HYH02_002939 [Chlamydomonas schloesseri]|uniref:RING-type domain-containing protein n=1 Tax=Chlamydomonas schloesseri TaxID=2026947 RepID=A0A836BAJ2_9CHLO|nr:hypothetical protein HYH02_002939 [Chlamydomonas schloesseri]|eukprot:KAG2452707.1 hypothetical protein HYH02_002939 [Chlamydomonas schloesseri]
MSLQLQALLPTLQQLLHVFRLTGEEMRLGVLAYLDWCDPWQTRYEDNPEKLQSFIESLVPNGGGDTPEAAKTAIWRLIEALKEPAAGNGVTNGDQGDGALSGTAGNSSRALVLWYTDAPPHTGDGSTKSNLESEQAFLKDKGAPFDWCELCALLAAAGAVVFPIVDPLPSYNSHCPAASFMGHMAAVTGGTPLSITQHSPAAYGNTSVTAVLSVLGYVTGDAQAFPDATGVAPQDDGEGNGSWTCFAAPKEESAVQAMHVKRVDVSIPALIQRAGPEDSLVAKFKASESYKATVYEVFHKLMTPTAITSITYNPVFAAMWRQCICANRKDPRFQPLVDAFSCVVGGLEGGDKERMEEFLANSYDRAAEIREMLSAVEQRQPALVLAGCASAGAAAADSAGAAAAAAAPPVTAKQVLELFRSCSPDSLRFVSSFLASLRVVEAGGDIPLALEDGDLFSVLLHLTCPGMLLAQRNAAVLAMVAVAGGAGPQQLRERAAAFLVSRRGKWIDAELPENFSYGFVRLALAAQAAVAASGAGDTLAPAELATMIRLRAAMAVKVNELTSLALQLPFTSKKTRRPDVKHTCRSCNMRRSFTLLLPDGQCGLCAAGEVGGGTDDDLSYWCECRACKVHYAVERPDLLKVLPKCHGCRKGVAVPSAPCACCGNRFAFPAASEEQQRPDGGFVCPPCAAGGSVAPPPETVEVSVREWLEAEPSPPRVEGFVINDLKRLWRCSAWDLAKPEAADVLVAVPAGAEKEEEQQAGGGGGGGTTVRLWRGKPITNLAAVLAALQEWLRSGKPELGCCGMCFGDVPKNRLMSVCGRRACGAVACGRCLDSWYGGPKPGANLLPAQLHCPFCIQRPAPKVAVRHNREACGLRGLGELEPGQHYAWCRVCYKAAVLAPRECMVEAPTVTQWACSDCAGLAGAPPAEAAKPCPGCGVHTQKDGGCNHITCSACAKHWCYECGAFSADEAGEVYEHMQEVHSGYYD